MQSILQMACHGDEGKCGQEWQGIECCDGIGEILQTLHGNALLAGVDGIELPINTPEGTLALVFMGGAR